MVRKKLLICSFVALCSTLSLSTERGPTEREKPPQSKDSLSVSISTHFSMVAPLKERGGRERETKREGEREREREREGQREGNIIPTFH